MVNVTITSTSSSRADSPHIDSQRQSYVSTSAASFKTALSHPESRDSVHSFDSSSSTHTVGAKSVPVDDRVNPIDLLSQGAGGPQELHILKINGSTVTVQHGPSQESLRRKASKSLGGSMSHEPHGNNAVDSTSLVETIGPPPPSPPASFIENQNHIDHREEHDTLPPPDVTTKPEPVASSSRVMISTPPPVAPNFSQKSSNEHRSVRTVSSNETNHEANTSSSDALKHMPSMDTRVSTHTTSSSQKSPKSVNTDHFTSQGSSVSSEPPPQLGEPRQLFFPTTRSAHVSVDGYLQPPPQINYRPARRNTTGSTTTSVSSKPSRTLSQQNQHSPHSPSQATEEHAPLGELDSDILEQAYQIRRERLSKRKAQQEAEEALTKAKDELKPLVGNLIGEDHANYILMYNMLTGIRIGVSKVTCAKVIADFFSRSRVAKLK